MNKAYSNFETSCLDNEISSKSKEKVCQHEDQSAEGNKGLRTSIYIMQLCMNWGSTQPACPINRCSKRESKQNQEPDIRFSLTSLAKDSTRLSRPRCLLELFNHHFCQLVSS